MILNGWRQISQHLGRGIRTVQRWEKLGLPVRRPNKRDRSVVVAFTDELDEWLRTDTRNQPPPGPAANATSTSGPFKHRLLLVDDDERLLVTMGAILIKEGCDVRTARDGFEALAAMRSGVPEILIADLKMPNMSGFELLAVVRRRFPAVGVIVLSAEFTPAMKPAILADNYIAKGVNSTFELKEAVRELLTQVPLRGQPAKADSAPVWIPRSTNGYIVLTCLDCLRSFSLATKLLALGEVGRETCIHCGEQVRYRIDETVLPAAAELPSVSAQMRSRVEISRATIESSKALLSNPMRTSEHMVPTLAKKTGTK